MSLRHLFSPLLRRFCATSETRSVASLSSSAAGEVASSPGDTPEAERKPNEPEAEESSPNKARKLATTAPEDVRLEVAPDEEVESERRGGDRLSPMRDEAAEGAGISLRNRADVERRRMDRGEADTTILSSVRMRVV